MTDHPLMTPRQYQYDIDAATNASHERGNQNVLNVLPTGAGKTVVKAYRAWRNYRLRKLHIVWAHRDVLIEQISMSLAKMGVPHTFICNPVTIRQITNRHMEELGRSYKDDMSPVCVSSIKSFLNAKTTNFESLVYEWNCDEAHHVQANNEWGKAIARLTNARGAGYTATPLRSDRRPLGRLFGDDADKGGVFDDLQVGIGMLELIEIGNLTPFRIFSPPTDLDLSGIRMSGGDYNKTEAAQRVDKRSITGNAVEEYKKICPGERAITFGVTIEHCQHIADEFNSKGVPSMALSSKSPPTVRNKALRQLRDGELLNLVNCDLFGEGFDLPAVVAGIMLRPTKSYGLYTQQFGRVLRPLEGKEAGIIIDHVRNVDEHRGPPTNPPPWDLYPERMSRTGGAGETLRKCPECWFRYSPDTPGYYKCPLCGHVESEKESTVAQREIQQVDGTLQERTPEDMKRFLERRRWVDIDTGVVARNLTAKNLAKGIVNKQVNEHVKRQHAQAQLRSSVQSWCWLRWQLEGFEPHAAQMAFEQRFGINIVEAQTLNEKDALKLLERVRRDSLR